MSLPVPVHLVLIAPQDIVNIASAVRICRNFGITSMRVVAPEVELDGYRIEGVAHNTAEFISRITVFDTLQPALADCVQVMVLTGRDKGRTGEVFEVRPDDNLALVRGINMVKRHQKQTQNQEGGIISKESPIHLSNIAYVGKDGKPTRVGFKIQADGKKVRVAKSSGAEIDG